MKDVRQSLASFRVDVPIGAKLRLIIYRRPQGRGIGPELVQRRAVMVLAGADSGLLPSSLVVTMVNVCFFLGFNPVTSAVVAEAGMDPLKIRLPSE